MIPLFKTLELEWLADGVLCLTISRPDRANAQTVEMFGELGPAVQFAGRSGARAMIVRGAGERAFCAGFDLNEIDVLTDMGIGDFVAFMEVASAAVVGLRSLPFPVVSAIHGAAVGGGLALALATDIRLASPTAKFSVAFIKVGLSAGELGTSWALTRLIGPGLAAELAFTGRMVDATEAERIGLVNRVVPADRLIAEAVELAQAVARNSPQGVRMSKRALLSNAEVSSLAAAVELENRGQALLFQGGDMTEALHAFREARPASFG
ncbi:MAG: enoyl-CoA hydratase [Marmoricola sp.]|nr:enoyl-CoA hydratase [Marmoricola sp.]